MNNNTNTKGLLYPNPCPHCGKENTKKGCYEFFGEQNGRKYGVCMRGNSPATGWEQALTRNKTPRTDKSGNFVYQEIIPYGSNGNSSKSYQDYKTLEATYYYWNKENKPLIKIDCYRDKKGEKHPYAYHYTSDGQWKLGYKNHIKREDIPIYRYSEIREFIQKGKPIWIVEGEKCAEKLLWLMRIGATCNIGGAGKTGNKWKDSDTECLTGAKEIILCPDRDRPGVLHMEAIYQKLLGAGFSDSSLKWLYVYPDSPEWDNIPEKKGLDIFDWIEDGATYEQIISSVQDKKRDIIKTTNQAYSREFNQLILDNVEKRRHQEILDSLNFILYDQNGKRKKILNDVIIKVIKIIYGDKLKYNLLTCEPMLDDQTFRDVEGDIELLHMRLANLYGIETSKEKTMDGLLHVAKQKSFHPVEEYLKRCAENVTPHDLDNLATKYLKVDTELANKYLKLWILAAAARAIYPGCYIRNVLILKGKQNIGKSTFFRLLGSKYFCDSLGDCKNKDQLLIAHRKWIHEWAEFEKLWRKTLRSEVKGFISSTEDTFRVPYGKSTDTHLRRFVLCGTSNEEQFLNDPTGNTRFWIIEIKQKIALEQLNKDVDAIWSAATQTVLNANRKDVMKGRLWELPKHLLEANEENTAKYEETHPWEDILQEVIETWGSCSYILSDKIWEALNIEVKEQKKFGMEISNIMTKLGWKKSRKLRQRDKKRYRLWILQEMTEEEIDNIWAVDKH